MTTYLATVITSNVLEAPITAPVTIVPLMPDGVPGVVGVGIVPGERVLLPRSITATPNAMGEVSFALVATADTVAGPDGVGVRYRAVWKDEGFVEFSMPRAAVRIAGCHSRHRGRSRRCWCPVPGGVEGRGIRRVLHAPGGGAHISPPDRHGGHLAVAAPTTVTDWRWWGSPSQNGSFRVAPQDGHSTGHEQDTGTPPRTEAPGSGPSARRASATLPNVPSWDISP